LNNQRIASAVPLPIGQSVFILWPMELPLCLVRHPETPPERRRVNHLGPTNARSASVHRHHEAAYQCCRRVHEVQRTAGLDTHRLHGLHRLHPLQCTASPERTRAQELLPGKRIVPAASESPPPGLSLFGQVRHVVLSLTLLIQSQALPTDICNSLSPGAFLR
jgi:hypothetical protein